MVFQVAELLLSCSVISDGCLGVAMIFKVVARVLLDGSYALLGVC